MWSAARGVHHSYAEYLTLEEQSQTRHEYFDGEIYAIAGGTPDHAALAASLIRLLGARLPRGCRAFTSDLRIRVPETGLSTYPDVTVVCGGSARATDDPNAVTNPVLLVEVTSPSTEQYDRKEKLSNYQRLPSLRDVLIVSHREPWITHVSRSSEGAWLSVELKAGANVVLDSLGAVFEVDEVYRDTLEDLV